MRLIDETNLPRIAQELADQDGYLAKAVNLYGPPPLWSREPGFATLLQIILEQQVSLASARACFDKLQARVGRPTASKLLKSTDAELRTDGFSRQKTAYARHLAEAVLNKSLNFEALHSLDDHQVRSELICIKGIGHWTTDIYLLMALRRPDVMPRGDIALHSAWERLSKRKRPEADEFLRTAEAWRPYRSVAARILWHYYLSEKANRSNALPVDG